MARFGRRYPVPRKYVWTNTVQAPASNPPIPIRTVNYLAVSRKPKRLLTPRYVWTNNVFVIAPVPNRLILHLVPRKYKRQSTIHNYIWSNNKFTTTGFHPWYAQNYQRTDQCY